MKLALPPCRLPFALTISALKRHLQRHVFAARLERWRLAIAYARDRLTADQAQNLILQCEPVAGWHPLDTLCVEDVLGDARDTFRDHPDLPRYIAMGCARVASKYQSDGEALHAARDWALDEAERYARADGLTFERPEADGEDQP